MRTILIILMFPILSAGAQIELKLDSCYKWARNNYPNLKQTGIFQEITALKSENLKTNWYPQATLTGQATYQSDVPHISMSLPGVTIPSVSKDQYKAYVEFRQTIWDGGLTKANTQLEESLLASNLNQLETEVYKLNEQVLMAFFTVATTSRQYLVLEAQKEVLSANKKAIGSAIKNGAAEKSSLLSIDAEMLGIEQNEEQLVSAGRAACGVLSFLTGKEIDLNSRFTYVEQPKVTQSAINRPELEGFNSTRNQLMIQDDLLKRSRYPKIYGFGQLGYGKPGLNMLNNEFDSFYLVGIGASWNVFDWKKTTRQRQIIKLQSQVVNNQEETFKQSINIVLVQQLEQINRLESLSGKDAQIVKLRNEITHAAQSKMENGAITVSEFVRELQNETIARLNSELHKIQLQEAIERYKIISGSKFNGKTQPQ